MRMKHHYTISHLATIFIVCVFFINGFHCIAEKSSSTHHKTASLWDSTGEYINDTVSVHKESKPATFQSNTDDPCKRWQLVTDESQLAVGDEIVITNGNSYMALSTIYAINSWGTFLITPIDNGNTINIDPNQVQIITLRQGIIPGTFALHVEPSPPYYNDGYLYAASSTDNQLKTQGTIDANSSWSITIDNDNNANIVAQGNNTHNTIRFNSNANLFSCYASGQNPVKIYKLGAIHGDTTVTACGSFTLYGKTFTSSQDTTIVLHAAAHNGCDSNVTWHIIIEEVPTIQILPVSPTICEGESITLTASCTGSEELFFSEGFSTVTSGSDTSTSSSSNKYQCDLINFPTCDDNDNNRVYKAGGHLRFGDASSGGGYITSRQINLSEPYTIKLWARGWNNSNDDPWFYVKVDDDTVMRQAIPVSSWDAPYTQYDYMSLTGATDTSTITIGNLEIKQRFFLDSIAIVSNTECQFAWNTGETNASITVNPTISTTYYANITSSEGCSNMDSVHVTVKPKPVVSLNPCGGTCNFSSLTTNCQQGIELPEATSCATDYEFAGWSTEPVNTADSTEPSQLYFAGDIFISLTDTTLYAVYKKCTPLGGIKFKKINANRNDWSGEYLIAYTPGNKIFDGSLDTLDAVNNYQSVVFSGDTVINAVNQIPYTFTISQINSDSCAIRSSSGYYIWRYDSNGLNYSTNISYQNAISYSDGNVIISGTGVKLLFNNYSNQQRFRYYGSEQKPIQLYRKEVTEVCEYISYPFYPSYSQTEIACESYTWDRTGTGSNDTTITDSGIYFYRHIEEGCMYVDTLKLTIGHASTGDTTAMVCDSFDWYEHTGIDTSGDYTHTFTTAAGCDSIVTLHLTVNPTYNVTDKDTICDSQLPYTWNGVVFTGAGTKNATLETVNGCDSVVTMTLTVNPTYNVTDKDTICDSQLPYTWNGVVFTGAGTKTATLETVNGCDSVVVMTLTVNPTHNVTDKDTICDSQLPYTWNGVVFTGAGTKTTTLEAVNGCDSVVEMTLTINPFSGHAYSQN